MRIQADCIELRRLANEMREHALGLAILGRACGGFVHQLPDMPSSYKLQAAEALNDAHKSLEDVAYALVRDSGEVYSRADWMEIAGIGGSSSWLYQFMGPGFSDAGTPSRAEWDRIVGVTITVVAMGVDGATTARKTASFIAKVWRWSEDPVKRSLASRQIRGAGRSTRWAGSKWLRRGGWALTILDGVFTFQQHKAMERGDLEALVRTTAEVGTPALAGWGAGALCILGVAGTPLSGGASALLCGGVGVAAGAATNEAGLGEWIGQRFEEEILHPEKYYIQIDVPPEGMTLEEYWDGVPAEMSSGG